MSWLFGVKTEIPPQGQEPPQVPSQTNESNQTVKNENIQEKEISGKMEAYRFDSTALERAAKLAKELEQSRFAKDSINISLQKEATRQKEIEARLRELEQESKMAELEKSQVVENERRKTQQLQQQLQQELAKYQDQLARSRYEEQLQLQRSTIEANKRIEEESLMRQEAIRKATTDYELEQRAKQDSRLMEAKAKAKAKARRENLDVSLAEIREKVEQQRITILESISSVGNMLGSGFQSFFSSYEKPAKLAAAVTLTAAGIYLSKGSTQIAARYVESHLFQPALIRESSRVSVGEFVKHPILTSKRLLAKPSDALKGVILSPEIEERIREIAVSTANTKKNKGKFRNLLLHGPPGTGKTLFAKKLALHSGLDYALMSGGDVLPLGRNAVTAILKVLDWANTSRRGLILFIDEADAFLSSRASMRMSEDLRAAVNTVLAKTGDLSTRFMLVVATNMADELDKALHNRIDITLEFGLPAVEERERLIRHYFDEFILQPFYGGKSKVKVEQFDFGQMCQDIAKKTEGFSGREIAKLVLSWQMAGYTSEEGLLTQKQIYKKLEDAIQQVRLYHLWDDQQESSRKKRIQALLDSSQLNLSTK